MTDPASSSRFRNSPQANTVAVVDRVRWKLERLQEQGRVPADLSVTPVDD